MIKLNSKIGFYLMSSIVMFSLILFSCFLVIEKRNLYQELKKAAFQSQSFVSRDFHKKFSSKEGISEVEYRGFLQEIKKYAIIEDIDVLYFLEYKNEKVIKSLKLPTTTYERLNPYESTYNIEINNPEYVYKAWELSREKYGKEGYKGIIRDGEERYLIIALYNKDYFGNKYAIVVGYSLKKVIINFLKKSSLIFAIIFVALSLTLIFLIYVLNKTKKSEIISASDHLTGFYTRKYLSEIKKKITVSETNYWGIIYADLDGLKIINDTYGHDAGDAFILEFSNALRSTFRQEDTIIRMGGDEFLIVTPLEKEENIKLIIDRIKSKKTKELPFSIGWEIASKKDLLESGLDEVINKADKKMYEDKRSNNK